MKKAVTILALALAFAAYAAPRVVQTAKIAFVNNTPAKLDTLQLNDSVWCTIDQRVGGRLADHIAVYLPNVLASGDSVAIDAELLPENLEGADYLHVNGNSRIPARNQLADQVDAPKSTGSHVFGRIAIGPSWKYGDGAKVCKWSPPDSALCNRVRIVIREIAYTANAVKLTDCDSLATSNAYVVWTVEE